MKIALVQTSNPFIESALNLISKQIKTEIINHQSGDLKFFHTIWKAEEFRKKK